MSDAVHRRLFVLINVVGGAAVLVSYVHGLATHPDTRQLVWGGVPIELRPLYTVSMLTAAAGYFPFTAYLLLRVEPQRVRFYGRYGFGLIHGLYATILAGSTLWMPLTFRMIDHPHRYTWLGICFVLALVGIASLGVLGALLTLDPSRRGWWYRLAIAGALAFCVQTLILDATVWPVYYPY